MATNAKNKHIDRKTIDNTGKQLNKARKGNKHTIEMQLVPCKSRKLTPPKTIDLITLSERERERETKNMKRKKIRKRKTRRRVGKG